MDFIRGLNRSGGYDSCLVITCGLSRFTRVFPCNEKITGEKTVKMFVENGSNHTEHLNRCTLMRMYASAVTQDGTNEY